MDLTQLANLGEFIGGVAVLVTLAYLALQMRQSNELERAESARAIATAQRVADFRSRASAGAPRLE